MGNKHSASRTRSVFTVIYTVAALLGIVAVFMAWIQYPDWYPGSNVTGWESISDGSVGPVIRLLPAGVLIFSVFAMITGVVTMFMPKVRGGEIAVFAGAIVFIAAIIFILDVGLGTHTYYAVDVEFQTLVPIDADPGASIGVGLAAAAGVVMALFGALAALYSARIRNDISYEE